jgi:hypothetical protein
MDVILRIDGVDYKFQDWSSSTLQSYEWFTRCGEVRNILGDMFYCCSSDRSDSVKKKIEWCPCGKDTGPEVLAFNRKFKEKIISKL